MTVTTRSIGTWVHVSGIGGGSGGGCRPWQKYVVARLVEALADAVVIAFVVAAVETWQ